MNPRRFDFPSFADQNTFERTSSRIKLKRLTTTKLSDGSPLPSNSILDSTLITRSTQRLKLLDTSSNNTMLLYVIFSLPPQHCDADDARYCLNRRDKVKSPRSTLMRTMTARLTRRNRGELIVLTRRLSNNGKSLSLSLLPNRD